MLNDVLLSTSSNPVVLKHWQSEQILQICFASKIFARLNTSQNIA